MTRNDIAGAPTTPPLRQAAPIPPASSPDGAEGLWDTHIRACKELQAERDRYREALTNVVAFACASERLTERQQLGNIYNVAKAALEKEGR